MSRRYFEKDRDYREKPLSGRATAVEVKCLDCCNNDWTAAKACTVHSCPLWPWGLAGKAERRSK